MKAWRNPKNQRRYSMEQARIALQLAQNGNVQQQQQQFRLAIDYIFGRIRVGRAVRDNFVRIMPVPSSLMQKLLLRAGVWNDGHSYIEEEAQPVHVESMATRLWNKVKNFAINYSVTRTGLFSAKGG